MTLWAGSSAAAMQASMAAWWLTANNRCAMWPRSISMVVTESLPPPTGTRNGPSSGSRTGAATTGRSVVMVGWVRRSSPFA